MLIISLLLYGVSAIFWLTPTTHPETMLAFALLTTILGTAGIARWHTVRQARQRGEYVPSMFALHLKKVGMYALWFFSFVIAFGTLFAFPVGTLGAIFILFPLSGAIAKSADEIDQEIRRRNVGRLPIDQQAVEIAKDEAERAEYDRWMVCTRCGATSQTKGEPAYGNCALYYCGHCGHQGTLIPGRKKPLNLLGVGR